MTNWLRRGAEDRPPYRYCSACVRFRWYGASLRARRHASFVIRACSFTSSFDISNRRESRDRLTDPCLLCRGDDFIDVFVSRAGFLGEASP